MMAQLPDGYEMIPAGFTADGSRKYRITGFYAELFNNLQVSDAALNEVTANIFSTVDDILKVFFFHCRK